MSVYKYVKLDRTTGKTLQHWRAEIRRKGYENKSAIFPTKSAANRWIKDNQATATLIKARSGKTFKQLVDDFMRLGHCAYATMYQLEFWIEQLGAKRVRDIGRGDINEAKLNLQARTARRGVPGGSVSTDRLLTPASVNRYLAALSKVFSFAVDQGILDDHPMKGGRVRKLKEGNGRTRILTGEEEQRLFTAAKASTWPLLGLFIKVLMTTGARKSEVLQLKWDQINLADSTAVLHKTKSGRARTLPLVSEVRRLLADASKVRPLRGDYVFFDARRPEKPKNINVVWTQCRKAAGLLNDRADVLDRVVLHSTRHTAVTKLLRGGASTVQAAAVSGHETVAMLKRYTHLDAADSVELVERLLGNKA